MITLTGQMVFERFNVYRDDVNPLQFYYMPQGPRVALDDGRVAMATLDTVDPEPLPAGHWMYEHPKVRLSAHVSWATSEHFTGSIAILVENLHRFVEGRPLRDLVDLTEGY